MSNTDSTVLKSAVDPEIISSSNDIIDTKINSELSWSEKHASDTLECDKSLRARDHPDKYSILKHEWDIIVQFELLRTSNINSDSVNELVYILNKKNNGEHEEVYSTRTKLYIIKNIIGYISDDRSIKSPRAYSNACEHLLSSQPSIESISKFLENQSVGSSIP